MLASDVYTDVSRYLGAHTHPELGKGMAQAETLMLIHKGLHIVSVWEGDSTRANGRLLSWLSRKFIDRITRPQVNQAAEVLIYPQYAM